MSVQQSLQITPSESFTTSPPTPPATEETNVSSISRVLAEVRRHKAGFRLPDGEHWLRFSIDAFEYEDLRRQLRKDDLWDYYESKLREHGVIMPLLN